MKTNADYFEALQKHTSLVRIAHHIPGRIRLKLNADMEKLRKIEHPGIDTRRFVEALNTIPGVRQLRLNKLARSVTVDYDNTIIPDQAWPDLLENRASPEATALRDCLQEKFLQAAGS